MLFCNLTPLDGHFANAIVFCRKSEFCKYITSLQIQHSIYVRQFEFFVFTMKQMASIFCNVSFAVQYTYLQRECEKCNLHTDGLIELAARREF